MTTKTVGAFKPGVKQGLKNLKIYKTPTHYLLELDGEKRFIEAAAVAWSEPV